jgi:hypothetical protein
MQNDQDYLDYLVVVDQIKGLEQKKMVIGERLMNRMTTEGVDKLEGQLGIITMAEKVSYNFSPAVSLMSGDLKKLKEHEVARGIAERKVTKYLRPTLR